MSGYSSYIPGEVQQQLLDERYGEEDAPSDPPRLSALGYSGFVCAYCRAAVTIAVAGDHAPGCEADPGDTTPAERAWSAAENERRQR